MPTVYRQLLRLGRRLDANPLSKALLIAQPAHLFDRRSRALVELPSLSGWAKMLERFNGGEFYAPENSAVGAVKASRGNPVEGDLIDTGLMALKALSYAVQGGEELASIGFDCGAPDSAVARISAIRAATDVRPGSLLLTHPVSCLKQPTLHHSVILIVAVDEDSVSGVIINKPLELSLGAAVSEDIRDVLGPDLASSPLYKGGDVSERQLLLLHDVPGLADSAPVSDGLFATNSFAEVREALEDYHAREAMDMGDTNGSSQIEVEGCAGRHGGFAPPPR